MERLNNRATGWREREAGGNIKWLKENDMNHLLDLQQSWLDVGLATRNSQQEIQVVSTFVEEVGTASAENVRSAALVRWLNSDRGSDGTAGPRQRAMLNRFVDGLGDRLSHFRAVREYTIGDQGRVDIAILDGQFNPALCVEAKWLATPDRDQLERYRSALGKNIALVSLAPVVLPQTDGSPTSTFGAVSWADLAELWSDIEHGRHTDSLAHDLALTVLRLNLLRGVVQKLVRAGGTVGEALSIHEWLRSSGPESVPLAELFKRLLLTELAEETRRRLNEIDGKSGWRRIRTVNGPNRDTQSDLTPRHLDDGMLPVTDSDRYIAVFVRFHAYATMPKLSVELGTELSPYLDGERRDEWIRGHGQQYQRSLEQLARVRQAVIEARDHLNLPRVGGSAYTKQWYKGFGGKDFSQADASLGELVNFGCAVASCISLVLTQ